MAQSDQLPALISKGTTKGITVVVSPLISLIQDQCCALGNKGIVATPFNSTMTQTERNLVLEEMKASKPGILLIYVTPELVSDLRLQYIHSPPLFMSRGLTSCLPLQLAASGVFKSSLQRLHSKNLLARFVIDEAHCTSCLSLLPCGSSC